MKNLNVHYFNNNKTLAKYINDLCTFLKTDMNDIEVRDDMAILELKDSVLVFTKNEEIMLELSGNCFCIMLHYVPDIKIVSQLMTNNTNFIFYPTGIKRD
jgi:hypothetical protein